jgi:indole-3-glycerol phosphate synthase
VNVMDDAAPQPADLLATIVAATRRVVEVRAGREPLAELERRARAVTPRPGAFREAVARPERVNVIAECKRRSPSRGILRRDYDPAAVARAYEGAGAAAVSVLTEPMFFDGSLDHLNHVRRACQLPVLRKDFIVDDYQIWEARAAGADALLLIVSALGERELSRLHATARDAGLDVLVEVHDVAELQPALAAGATLIGVNSRSLRTLAVDGDVGRRVIERMPSGVVAVAESGLQSVDDVVRLRRAGYSAFLIGEYLVGSPDPGERLRALLAGVGAEC